MKRKRFVPILALLLASLMLFAAPVCASSRLLGGVKVTLQRTAGRKSTEELRKQGYTISFGHKTRSNLTKSMTYSAVWLIPDTVLAKGNRILLDGALNIYSLKDLLCVGQVRAKSRYFVENKDGKVSIRRETYVIKQDKWVKAKLAGTASVKKSGNYYEVALKQVPYESVYHPDEDADKMLPLDLSTSFLISQELFLRGGEGCTIRKDVSDYVFFDGLQVNAGKKMKVTIRDFKYEWFEARKNGSSGKVPRLLKELK